MSDILSARLEGWKDALLDTSKRNRLLYFKPEAALGLAEPAPDDLWKRLVKGGKTLKIAELNSELFPSDEESDSAIVPLKKPLRVDEIRPTLSGTKLARGLYSLRSKGNLSIEEQGVPTLFVAWGLARWRAAKSGETYFSPLLLTPATLSREGGQTTYRVKVEDDIRLNPVLNWKLRSEFGVQLPDAPEAEDALLDYWDKCADLLEKRDGWGMVENAFLGLFAFHKMAMYEDLRDNSARALENPFVRALGGDASRLPQLPAAARGAELDNLAPSAAFCVLDCDSSQQEAVQAARAGASFVMQGPPGTGKSQTITNIIAESLAQGKRVLFVSEKMAALDVVHERLKRSGLDLFCLKAHSHANKKEVVDDLNQTLVATLAPAQQTALDSALLQAQERDQELETLRAELNAYVAALHRRRGVEQSSYFEAAGELELFKNAPAVLAALPDVMEIAPAKRQQWRAVLEEAKASAVVWRQGENHVWHGARRGELSLDLAQSLRLRAEQGARDGRVLAEKCAQLAERCGVDGAVSLERARHLVEGALLLDESPRPPARWLEDTTSLSEIGATVRNFKARYDALSARRARIDARYDDLFWQLPHAELVNVARDVHAATLARGGTWADWAQWGPDVAARLERVARALQQADSSARALCARLEIAAPPNLSRTASLVNALGVLESEWLNSERRAQATWFDSENNARLQTVARENGELLLLKNEAAKHLLAFDLTLLNALNCGELHERWTQHYGGFLRVLKGRFRADNAALTAARRGAKASYEVLRDELAHALVWQENARKLEWQREILVQDFGRFFRGDDTDWAQIGDTLAACERLNVALQNSGGTSSALRVALDEGGDLAALLGHLPELRRVLSELKDDWQWLPAVFALHDLPFQEHEIALCAPNAPLLPLSQWLDAHAANLRAVENALQVLAAPRRETNNEELRPQMLCGDAVEAAQILRDEATLCGESPPLREALQQFFANEHTPWNQVFAALNWTRRAREWWAKDGELRAASTCSGENAPASTCSTSPSPAFVALALQPGAARLEMAQNVDELATRWEAQLQWFNALLEQPISRAQLLEDSCVQLENWGAHAGELDAYRRWLDVRCEIETLGLGAFWDETRARNLAPDDIAPALEKRFWTLWLDAAAREETLLAQFSGARHGAKRARFAALDAATLESARQRLQSQLWAKKPHAMGSLVGGEIAILKNEATKKARHKPLRRLFREIPHLLRALKPCVLMSPLSIAQFMDAERAQFDVLIFDEASQICPEDAVGAMLRADQIIVVGDRKQLPPTRFFATSSLLDDDEEENYDDGVYESILDACAPHLPNFLLSWHYRSRDESLIAFSNRHFYDDKLITFPNAERAANAHRGVSLDTIPGVYIRGKGREGRTNPIEAARVAERVLAHAAENPHASLGVIALNAQQARAIDEATYQALLLRPELEAFFAREDEPFFVKALENVQGDERDYIILSIGYGPDEDGKVSLNFGPLNREGGERRLNVAVTRARDALCVVSSLQPEQIDTARTNARGAILLRAYLEMARRGGDSGEISADDVGRAPILHEIARALSERGWQPALHFGQSAQRIDLAVSDPQRAGNFVLAIEDDGSDYHTALTARDRDRLRSGVLNALGWKLLRLWTPDWLRDPAAQLQRIERALEADAVEAVEFEDVMPVDLATIPVDENDEESDTDLVQVLAAPHDEKATLIAPLAAQTTLQVLAGDSSEIYRLAELGILGDGEDFYFLLNARAPILSDAIVQVVEVEGPIAIATVARRVARAFGLARVGETISSGIMELGNANHRLKRRGDFWWPFSMETAPVRTPAAGEATRAIGDIAPEEIQQAVLLTLQQAFGMERAELVVAAARLLGFRATGTLVRASLEAQIEKLLSENRLIERGGALALANKLLS